MKLLLDMNLSPEWCETLRQAGWEAAHWSMLGAHNASGAAIMEYARQNNYVVLTHGPRFLRDPRRCLTLESQALFNYVRRMWFRSGLVRSSSRRCVLTPMR